MTINKKTKSFYTPAEVAEFLAVTVVTVRNLANSGELKSFTTAGKHRRFRYRDIISYAKKHKLTLNLPEAGAFKITIVDDDEQFSRMLQKLLLTLPYHLEVSRAESGFEAGFKVKEEMPDVLLLDVRMPGVNGIDVAKIIKNDPETSSVRIIGITGYADHADDEKMAEAGAECILHKPFGLDECVKAIGKDELEYFKQTVDAKAL